MVKVGGGLLQTPGALDAVLAVLAADPDLPLVVVPGGGPFADAVRQVDRDLRLTDEAAHWAAVLAMDQFAHVIASRLRRGAIAASRGEIARRLEDRQIPVVAPFALLRAADPLPHSWDVTSDSIAAWLAGTIGARRLVLVKPPGAAGDRLVDPWFARALPPAVGVRVLTADALDRLRADLRAAAEVSEAQA